MQALPKFSLRPLFSSSSSVARRALSTTPARSNLARMTLVGRLVAPPEMASSANGNEHVRYTIAARTSARSTDEASFFRVTAFEEDGPRRQLLLGLEKGALMFCECDARLRRVPVESAEADEADPQAAKTRPILLLNQRDFRVLTRPRSDADAAVPVAE